MATNIVSVVSAIVVLFRVWMKPSVIYDLLWSLMSLASIFTPGCLESGCSGSFQWYSFFAHTSLFGSEFAFLCLSIDLVLTLRNPFINSKHVLKVEIPLLVLGSCVIGSSVLWSSHDTHLSPMGICWFNTGTDIFSTEMVWYFFAPFLILYIIMFVCNFRTIYLQGGTSNDFIKAWSKSIYTTMLYICSFTFYWVVISFLFIFSTYQLQNIPLSPYYYQKLASFGTLLSVALGLKGFLTFLTYFLTIWIFKPSETNDSRDYMSFLRDELLFYIAKGIDACLSIIPAGILYSNMDYTEVKKIEITKEGSDTRIIFYDYAPKIFAYIRSYYEINAKEYKEAITHYSNEKMQESGAFIYYSRDHRYVVKTIKKSDKRKFLSLLEYYLIYISQNKYTYITRIFGLYSINLYGEEIDVIVMNNFLCFQNQIGITLVPEKYDLKGSYVDRKASLKSTSYLCIYCDQEFNYDQPLDCSFSPLNKHVPDVTYKDQDMDQYIDIDEEDVLYMYKQIEQDTIFLMSHEIMDYSLLVGIYSYSHKDDFLRKVWMTYQTSQANNRGDSAAISHKPFFQFSLPKFFSKQPIKKKKNDLYTSLLSEDENNRGNPSNAKEGSDAVSIELDSFTALPISSNNRGNSILSEEEDKHIFCKNETSFLSKSRESRYFIGIIDIFQEYNLKKKCEYFAKTRLLHKDKVGVSCVSPILYRDRFIKNVLDKHFPAPKGDISFYSPLDIENNHGNMESYTESDGDGDISSSSSSFHFNNNSSYYHNSSNFHILDSTPL
ncbi:hypothetical protein WA158_004345 [Blastocystis sp. Blastoise]